MAYHAYTQEILGRREEFVGVSNEGLPILATRVCNNNWRNLLKKLLPVRRKTPLGIRKRKKGEQLVTEETRSHLSFFENWKKCSDCVYLRVKILIKTPEYFPGGHFFHAL